MGRISPISAHSILELWCGFVCAMKSIWYSGNANAEDERRDVGRYNRPSSPPPVIIFYTDHSPHNRANAACLLGCFAVLCLLTGAHSTPQCAYPYALTLAHLCEALQMRVYPPLLPFRDADHGISTFDLHVQDVLTGLHKAHVLGWLPPDPTVPGAFDCEAYFESDRLDCGNWNWIVPGRVMAFPAPIDVEPSRSVERILPVLRRHNVRLVVALNEDRTYSRAAILQNGIRHVDLSFPDGTTPTDTIARSFLEHCESVPSAGRVAVHCKAGLGRTGTLIGALVMKHYGFSAREYIGWARLCRPGMVLGPQQQYLVRMEHRLSRQGFAYRKARQQDGTLSLTPSLPPWTVFSSPLSASASSASNSIAALIAAKSQHSSQALPAVRSAPTATLRGTARAARDSRGGTPLTPLPPQHHRKRHFAAPRAIFITGDGNLPFPELKVLLEREKAVLQSVTR